MIYIMNITKENNFVKNVVAVLILCTSSDDTLYLFKDS